MLEELGQPLSPYGGVFPQEQGPDSDEFFLTFEVLGANVNVRTDPVPLASGQAPDLPPAADIGVRIFDEIAETMSQATGVPRTHPEVQLTYEAVRQQMPSDPLFGGFLASQQVGISQLAVEFCNALVQDTALRASFFPGMDFNAPAATAFASQAGRDLIVDPVVDAVAGTNLASQPARADMENELNALITRLTACGSNCASDRTETVGTAVCSAALGSAAMLVQ